LQLLGDAEFADDQFINFDTSYSGTPNRHPPNGQCANRECANGDCT
jgi:hypothetical protein